MYTLAIALLAFSTFVSNAIAKEEYLILEIYDASTDEINNALREIEIEYKFKTKGTSRHLIVVKQNDLNLEKLEKIEIPGKSYSTPVRDLADVMEELGVTWPKRELTNVNVTLFERILNLKGKTMEQYKSEQKAYGELVAPLLSSYSYRALRANGAYPPKTYFFINIPRQNLDDASNKGIDILGGPGDVCTRVQYLTKLP